MDKVAKIAIIWAIRATALLFVMMYLAWAGESFFASLGYGALAVLLILTAEVLDVTENGTRR